MSSSSTWFKALKLQTRHSAGLCCYSCGFQVKTLSIPLPLKPKDFHSRQHQEKDALQTGSIFSILSFFFFFLLINTDIVEKKIFCCACSSHTVYPPINDQIHELNSVRRGITFVMCVISPQHVSKLRGFTEEKIKIKHQVCSSKKENIWKILEKNYFVILPDFLKSHRFTS